MKTFSRANNDIRSPVKTEENSTQNWYAVYTRSRFEKVVAAQLSQRNYEYFLPLMLKLRCWRDRKKVVKMPIFPGYVFVCINLADRVDILKTNGVVRFVEFDGRPSAIPENQIEGVRKLLLYPERVECIPYFNSGDTVEITVGPLTGLSGKIIQTRGKQRLLVGVDIIQQAISVELDASWLKDKRATPNFLDRSVARSSVTPELYSG